MATVPQTLVGKIEFFEQHLPVWAASPTAIGLTAPQIAALNTLVTQARADYQAALTARNAAKAKTEVQNNSFNAMAELGGDYIRTIRAYADLTNNPNVYSIAQIPSPQPPQPIGPPQVPTNVRAVLNNNGQVDLKWNGSRTGGTSFRIERNVTPVGGSASGWHLIDVVEERSYIDSHVPQGLASALYRVIAQRSGGMSVASEPGQVIFGTGSSSSSSSSAGEGGLSLAA